jgi:Phage integrase, N-terminal SAM-like domain
MSEKPISPLRQRMIEDMTVRNFVEKTRNDYIRQVKTFTSFLGRSPDTATAEDLRRFQLHQTRTGIRPPSINGSVSALRFFFTVTLDRPEMARHLTFVREPRKLPAVLSPEEVARLLEAAPGPKYKAALSAAYAAGLRVSDGGDLNDQHLVLPPIRRVIVRPRAHCDPSHLPCHPNPHNRVRSTFRAPLPAGSFFGGFRTTAPMLAAPSRLAVIRNPEQKPTSGRGRRSAAQPYAIAKLKAMLRKLAARIVAKLWDALSDGAAHRLHKRKRAWPREGEVLRLRQLRLNDNF